MKGRSLLKLTRLLLFAGLVAQSKVWAQPAADYKYSPPANVNDGIKVGTLKSAKLDDAKIVAGTNEIRKGTYPNIHSLLIFRDGKLVYENYFSGEDSVIGKGAVGPVDHSRETLHDMRSISKSVVALAVLIALSQGKIKSLNQRVFDILPEHSKYATGQKKELTIKHLLTMSSGLKWDEGISYADPANSERLMTAAPDPVAYFLSQVSIGPPGKKFNYSGGCTQTLAAVIKKVTGLEVDVFVSRNLFKPLGIKTFEWVKRDDGIPRAASGLRLRSRDIAKLGLLMMNGGTWNGKRIVPSKLIGDAMAEQIRIEPTGKEVPGDIDGYGYQIWRPTFLVDGEPITMVEFDGNGGQLVDIDMKYRTMLVVTAGNYNKRDVKKSSIEIFGDVVYPAILDRKLQRSGKAK